MRRIIYCSQATMDFSPEELVQMRLRLVMDKSVSSRMFPDWTMGFEHLNPDELAHQVDGFVPESEHPLVNPDLIINGEVAQRLLGLYAENRVRA